jgi:chloramphenicol 3-O-phosphotransferase
MSTRRVRIGTNRRRRLTCPRVAGLGRSPVTARILILTGASSTGKSTVAQELQRLSPTPAIFLEADRFGLPSDARSRSALRTNRTSNGQSLQLAMCTAFYQTLKLWLENDINVIAETIFRDDSQISVCRSTLEGVPYSIVRLVCEDAVQLDRERQRTDRRPGVAQITATTEVIPADLDLELDTSRCTPFDAAAVLLRFL